MQQQKIEISKLVQNKGQIIGLPKNPRLIKDDRFKKLVKSLKDDPEMMELREIIAYDNNGELIVICGNMRLSALKELKEKTAFVKILPQNTSVEKLKAYTIKDNIPFGINDWDALANEWDVDLLNEWGMELPVDWGVKPEAHEDGYEIPDEIETDIVLCDLFEIGPHRLLCGDSTDSDQVARLMNGEKADLVFTDPPYGISVVQGSSVGGEKLAKVNLYSKIIGDNTTDTAKKFYQTCISFGMGNFIIWGGNYFTDFLPPSMCWLIWDKENTGNFADVEIAWTSFDKAAKLYRWQWNGMIRKGDKDIEGKTRVHPTQKPVGLFGGIFNDFQFTTCFDGFIGSGTTMVAAHQLNRKCYGMEIDPKYCQVIIDRMRKLDPSIEIKKNGEPYNATSES